MVMPVAAAAGISCGAVGTAKRERQKANRAKRLVEEAETDRSDKRRRTALQVGLGLVAAVAAVVLIVWVAGGFSGDEETIITDEPSGVTGPEPTTPDPSAAPMSTPQGSTPDASSAPDASQAPAGSEAPAGTDGGESGAAECPAPDGSTEKQQQFNAPHEMCIDPAKTYTAEIVTNHGTITVDLDPQQAPSTVNNFVTLARYHYYDDTICHRIINEFMMQCGDPTATGTGGPGYAFDDELPEAGEYQIGSLAMANSGPNTNGSQFFIITGEQGVALPPQYSLFGQVTEGLEVADEIQQVETAEGDKPVEDVAIESITITES